MAQLRISGRIGYGRIKVHPAVAHYQRHARVSRVSCVSDAPKEPNELSVRISFSDESFNINNRAQAAYYTKMVEKEIAPKDCPAAVDEWLKCNILSTVYSEVLTKGFKKYFPPVWKISGPLLSLSILPYMEETQFYQKVLVAMKKRKWPVVVGGAVLLVILILMWKLNSAKSKPESNDDGEILPNGEDC
ncbi:hypothetical protein COLO4_34836 [Corchorus olitorius]|uniref:Uncharacterized protein n=1 Tax=Corchorus olitorius TaxID=93759 RepID=A0A1R3GJ89_9ROSI|nr:hypothetical protein COLO4_34836 [Corchorus olitorius]